MPGKGTSKRYPHGKSIRYAPIYDALRKKGYSKAKAAAISNATGKKASAKRKRKKRGK